MVIIVTELEQFSGLKIFNHLDRLVKLEKGETFYPISVDLSPTNACNHGCVWCCYNSSLEGNNEHLSREVMLKLIKELKDLGVKGINVTGGGEPLVNKDTVSVMEEAKKLGFDLGLITNGDLLDDDSIKRLMGVCLYIRVSLDAGTSATYKKLHNVDSFDKVISNIGKLVRAKQDSGSGCSIGAQFLVHAENKDELLGVAKKLNGMGVDFLQVRPVVQAIGSKISSKVEKESLVSDEVKKLSDDKFKVIVAEHKFEEDINPMKKGYDSCLFHYLSTAIGADGNVYLCCHFIGKPAFSFGNINEKSFKEIWDSEKRKMIARNLRFCQCEASCKGDRINKLLDNVKKIPHSNIL